MRAVPSRRRKDGVPLGASNQRRTRGHFRTGRRARTGSRLENCERRPAAREASADGVGERPVRLGNAQFSQITVRLNSPTLRSSSLQNGPKPMPCVAFGTRIFPSTALETANISPSNGREFLRPLFTVEHIPLRVSDMLMRSRLWTRENVYRTGRFSFRDCPLRKCAGGPVKGRVRQKRTNESLKI